MHRIGFGITLAILMALTGCSVSTDVSVDNSFLSTETSNSTQISTTTEAPGEQQEDAKQTVAMEWAYYPEKSPDDPPDYMPITRLTLKLSGAMNTEIPIGTYIGSPGNMSSAEGGVWSTAPGSLMTNTSWWAGGGDEYSVYRTSSDALEVRHRWISEGGLEEDGTVFDGGYGPFETVISIPISAGAILQPGT